MIELEFINWIKKEFIELYACQKNLSLPVYKMEAGHQKRIRIDFIGITKKGTCVAIEYEDGDTFGNITKGMAQLEDLYRVCQNENVKIYDSNKTKILKPKLFLLATQYSIKNYIWKNDIRVEVGGWDEKSFHRIESHTAFALTRCMWRLLNRTPYSETNPIGVGSYSCITCDIYSGRPQIELKGHYKFKIGDI